MLGNSSISSQSAEEIGNVLSGKTVVNKMHDERVAWVDAAKGVGIILVVIGHTMRGLESANILSFEGYFGQIDKAIYLFHMPLMFLLSGLFIHKALPQNWFRYVSKHAQRLLWPLILWTYVFFLCRIMAGSLANHPVGWKDFPFIPLPPKEHLWFLWALFLGFIIIKGVYALCNAFKIQVLSWPLIVVISLIFLVVRQSYGLHSPLMEQAFLYLPYILVGMSLRLMFRTNPGYILVASLVGYLATFLNPLENITILHDFGIAVCISTAIVSVLAILSKYATYAWLALLGQASMAIYLTHTIVSAFARSILLALQVNDVALHIVVGISVGLLVPLIAFISIKNPRTLRFLGW